jgi:hypothetical protein
MIPEDKVRYRVVTLYPSFPTKKFSFPTAQPAAILPQSRGIMSTNLPSFDKAQDALTHPSTSGRSQHTALLHPIESVGSNILEGLRRPVRPPHLNRIDPASLH